ncbi:MAG: 16S rRNA (uracil(1498)-N(3))-methyltransferase [Candidatus Omnitrophica bacterium]|nr:16S rRNA (uracil(1498)-N(3))-methyltransferase [Candidatus Omnitrophota bacterium]
MHRFFANLKEDSQNVVIDDADELHHLTHALRLKPGDRVELINGCGLLAEAEILSILKKEARLLVLAVRNAGSPRLPRIILACAIPKKSRFEDIIDKCTQLGVDEIIPMITERTECVLSDKALPAKIGRYQKVLRSAVKQSKRLFSPVIHAPMLFDHVLKNFCNASTASFIPWLEGSRIPLKEALAEASGKEKILFLIGPEGDFTLAEVAQAKEKGAVPVSLGPNVLRVDTAAQFVAGMAVVLRQ